MAGTVEGIDFVEGTLARGFCFPAANLVVLSAAELFGRFAVHPRRLLRLRRAERHRAQIDFSELAEGDLIVHLEHGIGRFLGLEKFPVGQAHRLPLGFDAGRQSAHTTNGPIVVRYFAVLGLMAVGSVRKGRMPSSRRRLQRRREPTRSAGPLPRKLPSPGCLPFRLLP